MIKKKINDFFYRIIINILFHIFFLYFYFFIYLSEFYLKNNSKKTYILFKLTVNHLILLQRRNSKNNFILNIINLI